MLKAELAGLDDGHHRRISPSSLAGNRPFKCENRTEKSKGKGSDEIDFERKTIA